MARHERDLRRAVSRLSECAIEDMEQIWSGLNAAEQERLRPLLAESGGIVPQSASAPRSLPIDSNAQATEEQAAEEQARKGRLLVGFIESVPAEMAARICHGLQINQEHALLAALSKNRAGNPLGTGKTFRLTPRAGQALVKAALESQAPMSANDPAGSAGASGGLLRGIAKWKLWR